MPQDIQHDEPFKKRDNFQFFVGNQFLINEKYGKQIPCLKFFKCTRH